MKKLRDYSGPFKAGIKLEDFSKETLVELVKLYSRLYIAIDGFWFLAVREKMGEDTALACDLWAWDKEVPYEMKRIAQALKIKGRDLEAIMKLFQFEPWFLNMKYAFEVEGKSKLKITVTHCPTLEALEKEGKGREKSICHLVEPVIFQKYIQFFSPQGRAVALKLPPRQGKGELCCQWEFLLEPGEDQGLTPSGSGATGSEPAP